MSVGWLSLFAMIVAYGVANLLQSVAANRVQVHDTLHPGLFVRLAGHKTYVIGVVLQFVGFLLAFLARRDLPLYLVQASSAAGIGVMVVLGVVLLRWRIVPIELGLILLLTVGIAAQVLAAKPGPAHRIGAVGAIVLLAAIGAIGALALLAVRLRGSVGSVALGSLAGMAFGAGAIASRPLASVPSLSGLVTSPLLYLLILHSILAQLLLGLAMQRGSATAAVAAMDAASAIPAAVVGLLFLGDGIRAGMHWLALTGFCFSLCAVLLLSRYAEPQPRRVAAGQVTTFGPADVH
ncbi:hypothetical protein Athai_44210 [Actinocatenispora thailandica]|uniref:Uncharacterized protein n=2 Tax=Actinocatenispora thailandica TaxID=227318 RepID=A0A7R7HYA0_9ACTN|nr:hypothetical protein Athai_44210 [Actinocatenispora thailandica]